MLVASTVVIAGKPDKPGKPPKDPPPPPPEGTMYFTTYNGVDRDMWTMNTDGSGKTQLGVYQGIDGGNKAFGEMSRLQHGGHYWFIRFETVGGKYPDGALIREIFAVRDDGAVEVQLTNDPTLETCSYARALIWSINDESIAWGAFRWVNGFIDWDSFGIYSADISFDANGDVNGLGAPSLLWYTGYAGEGPYIANVKRFDFSPDGSKLVLAKFGAGQYDNYIVDLGAQTETPLGTNGYRVKWSPDGSKIAMIEASSLVTINPDGTGKQILVEYSRKGNTYRRVKDEMGWSPDGNYLHYTWMIDRMGNDGSVVKYSVRYVEANGDNPTSLTDDLPDDTYPHAHAWR
jgi:Tol biopolymer transport system component